MFMSTVDRLRTFCKASPVLGVPPQASEHVSWSVPVDLICLVRPALWITGIRASFGKHDTEAKLLIRNITSKAALWCCGEQERRPTTGSGTNKTPETVIRPCKIGPPEKS
jgi:hypothetical protein